jgi:putative oxidoreductase
MPMQFCIGIAVLVAIFATQLYSMKDWINLLSRIFLSAIFFFEAYDTAYYKSSTFKSMATYGLQIDHHFIFYSAVTLLILGGVLLLLGYRMGLAAFLLLLYMVPYTLIVHNFWKQSEPTILREQAIHFLKNVSIMGGLLSLWSSGGGRFSLKRIFASTRS